MIRFACTCGHRFALDDEEAGGLVQCTRCGRLNDVPNHSDLLTLAPDGTYALDDGPPADPEPERMAELRIIYAKTKVDAEGNEIDLRTLPAGRRAGGGPAGGGVDADDGATADGMIELMPIGEPERVRPRYDPETGELIRPIDLQRDPGPPVDPASIPLAKPALHYASSHLARSIGPIRVLTELFTPVNLIVMLVVFGAHLFHAVVFVSAMGVCFVWPAVLIVQGLILSHYGNVIDDVGRNEHESLPRPMRDLGYEDLWVPFSQMFGGLLLAYVPPVALALAMPGPSDLWLLLAAAAGTVVAPALLLTTNTSGATNNLRPDRVLAVMRIAGGHYVVAVALWAVAWPVYFLGSFGLCVCLSGWFGIDFGDLGVFDEWLIVLPSLVAGIYLMHAFAWHLGLVYRAHHEQFPWVLQRHIRDPNKARPHRTHADALARKMPRGKPGAQPIRPAPVGPPDVGHAAPVEIEVPGTARAPRTPR
jgi:hypothetical protein